MIKERMLNYLPSYYRELRDVNEMFEAQGEQVGDIRANLDDLARQFHVDTATWGLARWERLVGLPEGTHELSSRRSEVKSKLQGHGTITESKIKELCRNYTNGNVRVDVDSSAFTVTITYIDVVGVPLNFDNLEKLLRELIPAHLELIMVFLYEMWSGVRGSTWSEAEAYTWNELREGVL